MYLQLFRAFRILSSVLHYFNLQLFYILLIIWLFHIFVLLVELFTFELFTDEFWSSHCSIVIFLYTFSVKGSCSSIPAKPVTCEGVQSINVICKRKFIKRFLRRSSFYANWFKETFQLVGLNSSVHNHVIVDTVYDHTGSKRCDQTVWAKPII